MGCSSMHVSTIRAFSATLLWLALCLSVQAQPQCPTTPAVGTNNSMCASTAFVAKSKGTLVPGVFANLPTCSGANEGTTAAVTNSTTIALGAIITGGGSNHVLAYCDGSNWTVSGADNPGYNGGAWTTYVATLTVDTGVISQVSSSSFLQVGKIVFFQISENLTIVSGSPTQIQISLPVAPKRLLSAVGRIGPTRIVATARFISVAMSSIIRMVGGTTYVPVTNDVYEFAGTYEAN